MIHHHLTEEEINHLNFLHQVEYCHDCKSSILNGYCIKNKCVMPIDRQSCKEYVGVYKQKNKEIRDKEERFISSFELVNQTLMII